MQALHGERDVVEQVVLDRLAVDRDIAVAADHHLDTAAVPVEGLAVARLVEPQVVGAAAERQLIAAGRVVVVVEAGTEYAGDASAVTVTPPRGSPNASWTSPTRYRAPRVGRSGQTASQWEEQRRDKPDGQTKRA